MNKPLKDTLNSNEKLEYILEQQSKGYTRNEIYKMMGYSNIKNIDDFMKRRGYIKENNLFIEGDKGTPSVSQTTKTINNTKVEVIDDKNNIGFLQDISIQHKLINMLERYDKFNDVIDWFENMGQEGGNHTPNEIIEVVTGLDINFEETETIKTSMRIDKGVWENFKKLGDKKYSHIANNKLLSQAVHEFIEKYK